MSRDQKRRIGLTGADGFIGHALQPALAQAGFEVVPIECELTDEASVRGAFTRLAAPLDLVIHLAGVSAVPECEKNPKRALEVNLFGTKRVLDSLPSPAPAFVFVSTAQVYAEPKPSEASAGLNEQSPVHPRNVYAETKLKAEALVKDWATRAGSRAVILRLFNHTHKSQSPLFFLPHVYQQLLKSPETIPVGDLSLERDIGSVQDLVLAFRAVCEGLLKDSDSLASEIRIRPGETRVLNVCSGSPKRLESLALGLASRLGVSTRFAREESRVRPGELKRMVGSTAALTKLTGWRPSAITESNLLDQFLADLTID